MLAIFVAPLIDTYVSDTLSQIYYYYYYYLLIELVSFQSVLQYYFLQTI